MDRQSLVLLIPILALSIPVLGIVMGGILKLAKLRIDEAKVRAGGLPDGAVAELDQMRTDMEDLRRELAEVHERLDFTERLLAQRREQERLPGNG